VALTINTAQDDGGDESADRQRRLVDELLDELTSIKGRDRSRMFRAWHECGVSVVQLSAANLLEVEGPMAMGRLADSLGISVASATGVVDRMEERNLVVRRTDPADRRLVIVHAAEGTEELFRTMEQMRREHLSRLLEQLTADELSGFLTGMRALRAARERADAAMATEAPAS
jgi:DNA-binding MarR family transcriptional regulator